jgi:hypothetical protein
MKRLAAALLVSAAAVPAAGAADRALLIGIDSYPKILVGGVAHQRDLAGAVNDARRMEAVATGIFGIPAAEVVLLADEDATRDGILSAIRRELVEKTGPGDRVLLYYAGHGAQVADESGDETEDGLDEVIVPYDAEAELASDAPTLGNVVLDDEVDSLIAEMDGREVTIVVDSCHSGTITRSVLASRSAPAGAGPRGVRTITPNGPLQLAPDFADVGRRLRHRADARMTDLPTRGAASGPRLAVWTAVTSAQYALEDMSVGGTAGLFTSRFVRGLTEFAADANGNGVITPAELLDYLRVETQLYCGKYDCLGQDPLPMLEAFDGYGGAALARRTGTAAGEQVATAEPVAGATVVRNTGEDTALPSDLLPAHGEPVRVVLEAGAAAPVGTPLRLSVTAPRAGRLVVLDRRADGTVVQLFPNAYSAAMGAGDLVKAGDTVRIPGDDAPFELVADAPGRGVVTALIVDPSADLDSLLAANGNLETIADAETYAAVLSEASSRAIVMSGGGEAALEQPVAAPTVARGDAAYEITAR